MDITRIALFEEATKLSRQVQQLGGIVQNPGPIEKPELLEWMQSLNRTVQALQLLKKDIALYAVEGENTDENR